MIDKQNISKIIQEKIAGTTLFLVEIKIDSGNNISVFLDSENGVTIDECIEISRYLEDNLDREVEDFSLEVSSAGIGQPFKVKKQYEKNVGKTIAVLLKNGLKIEGKLKVVGENDFEISYKVKEKIENEKRPKLVDKIEKINFEDAKSVIEIIKI